MRIRSDVCLCVSWLMAMAVLVPPAAGDAATIMVGRGGSLQAALDAAQHGDTILLDPGAVYVGNFVVRRGVTIRTGGPLPDGRVGPAWSGRLAILQSPNNMAALRTGAGISQLRLIGLEIAPNANPDGTALLIGSTTESDALRQPRDVVIDRVLLRGHPRDGHKRGISLHGSHITVTRSHVSDIKAKAYDTQAIWINNGWGPYTITDNYLEASGENILTGGDTPRIDRLVPADIRIEGNTIAKPLAWKNEGWAVKNLIELKSARRVVIRGNRLEGSWLSAQIGYGLLLTPKDQYGRAPWTTVQDVLVEYNVIHEVGEAIRVLGDDHVYPVERARRFTFRHNLLVVDAAAHGGSGRCLVVGRAPQEIEFSFNTCIGNGSAAFYTFFGGDVRQIHGGVFRRNVFLHGSYGFSAEGATAGGMAALTLHYPGGVLAGNLIAGGSASRYPSCDVIGVSDFQAQFVDYGGGDFRLTAAARARFADAHGTYPGVNFTALAGALGAISLTSSSEGAGPDPQASQPPPPPAGTLPDGWSSGDIGSVSPAGAAGLSGGILTVSGSGADIWNTADAFHFASRTLTGDGRITARVASVDAVDPWTKAGVMMRETLQPGSRHAMVIVSPSKGLAFQRRVATNGVSTHTSAGSGTAPAWVRLEREGHTFRAFVSPDGERWTFTGAETIVMPETIHVGLPVTSHRNGTSATARFEHVTVERGSALPSGWSGRDVGPVAPAGTSSGSSGAFAVAGAGADIWGTADAFHFVSRTLTGDGTIVARVSSVEAVDQWTKAGVMMRETLDPGSRHAMMIASPSKGAAFQRRVATGGVSTHTTAGPLTAPHWVRLVRTGHTFHASVSMDGTTWTPIGSETMPMAQTIHVGIAVTSHRNGTLAHATFEGVQVQVP
jgi:regulation of enolase protein 1 (concanavalin A-like superfamily)